MADDALWARRVAEWRASGEPSTSFASGQDFSASALRYWAKRLEREAQQKPVRLARIVRADVMPLEGRGEIVVEVGRLRVVVGRDFDRETLRAVVEVLSEIDPARVR